MVVSVGNTFCGDVGGPLWDLNLTWYGSKPDFTACFKDTALFWIPSGVFWLLLPFDVAELCRSRGYPSKSIVGHFQLAFQTLTTIIFLAITSLNIALWRMEQTVWFWWGFASYMLYAITMIAIIILSWHQMKEGFTGSAAIWLSLFFSVICGSVHFTSVLDPGLEPNSIDPVAYRLLFIVYYVLTVLTLIVFSFSSVPTPSLLEETEQPPFPDDFCSFPNRLAFCWVLPMLWKAYKRDLDIQDIWAAHPTEKSAYLVSHYEEIIRKEFSNTVESKKFAKSSLADEVTIKSPQKSPSLMKILAKEFGGLALVAGMLELINVILTFVSPIVVGLLTSFATNIHNEQIWHGYVYAALLACALFSQACLEQFGWFKQVRLGRKVNAVIVGCIYRKALRLTSEARKSSTLGEIVNLMSVDAGRFFDFALDMHTVWSAPLQFILGCYIAYRQVGVAVWAGVGYIVAVSLINGLVSRYSERFQHIWDCIPLLMTETLEKRLFVGPPLLVERMLPSDTFTGFLQEQQMELKDERVKLLTEVLNGMKVIKLYGWEPAFQRRIGEIREQELKRMRYGSYIGAFYQFSWNSTALLASLAVLATYVALQPDHSLKAEPVFVIITVFRILTFPLSLMPAILAHFAMIRVSLKRVTDYLSSQEIEEGQFDSSVHSDAVIHLENATFAWDSTIGPILRDLSVDIPQGKLVAVVGKVGAGKSSFLSALCGEMHKAGGIMSVQGSIGYVSQQAWIQNTALKDNILFGKALNERNYNTVVDACCLRPDLDSLPAGDQTEIGERGINLSGGQKQRVSLARAVYQKRDIYLLDDPLSAVDVHVGKHIFEHVIGSNGILKNKTRILVTHALTYLPYCDLVLVIADGRIQEAGSFQELIAKRGAFADFIQQYLINAPVEELAELQAPEFESLESLETAKEVLHRKLSPQTQELPGVTSPLPTERVTQRLLSISSDTSSEKEDRLHLRIGAEAGNLIDPEVMQIGEVTWSVYGTYAKAAGAGLVLFASFVFISMVFEMLGNIWLKTWSDSSQSAGGNGSTQAITMSTGLLYLGLCGLGQMTFTLMLGVSYAMFQVKASKLIHDKLLYAILKASMVFFDTTPTGRIINRCGKDINSIDNDVPSSLDQYCHFLFALAYSIIGLFIFVPVFGGILLPAGVVYVVIQRVYVAAGRRVRRLEAVTNSPIYSHFQETLQGVSTIRAFDEGSRFCDRSDRLVDIRFSAQITRSLFNRFVAVSLNLVSSSIVTATIFSIVYMVIQGRMTAGVAGLSLSSFALNLPGLLAWGVHVASIIEMEFVSLERIIEYSNIEPEAPWTLPLAMVPSSWPSQGRVLFRQYGTRYREGLPLVLCDLTADIRPLEKIGIVGRTGAGKSSLTLALFRIIEAAEGSILIDDVDISRLGLHELRRKLTIIPQDPVLFSGSLRMNLDPFDQYTDEEVWLALEQSSLKGLVTTLSDGLEYHVDEGGSNLSVGQRQLICLSRALLRKSKILVLDEATAAIDVETDAWIQATIREQFKDCTIITIAHRLNTIMDSDRILVLDYGRVMECDSPGALAAQGDSMFGRMLKEANQVT